MPAKLPMEENASDLWSQALAVRALELIFLAALMVYQYMASFETIEIIAAARAIALGMGSAS